VIPIQPAIYFLEEKAMSKESLENVQISDGNANVSSLLSPELADYNKTSVQNRSVDKSLTVNADNTLSFGVNDLYGDSSQKSRTGSTNDLFISSKATSTPSTPTATKIQQMMWSVEPK
jgi:hypothetical protein